MKSILDALIIVGAYILTMIGISLVFGMDALNTWKWPVCVLFMIVVLFNPFKKKSKWKRVDPDKFKNMKFELAPQDKAEQVDTEIRLMLSYMFEPEDKEVGDTALITDESTLGDFFWDAEEFSEALKRLNSRFDKPVKLGHDDYLWEAVGKIKKQYPNWPNIKLIVNK